MKKVVIIGAGQFGSRHLQGILKLPFKAEIKVVDPSESSLNLAMQRSKEVDDVNDELSVEYFLSMPKIKDLDLAIIATTSSERKKAILELLETNNPKCILLEKVVFQNLNDFESIISIFNEKKIKSWVNCPHRIYKSYINLKNNLTDQSKIQMEVYGGHWGLASNLVHYLDLFSFLTNCDDLKIFESFIDDKIYPSKREGFLELGGTIFVMSARKDMLTVTNNMNSKHPVTLKITSDQQSITIFESEEKGLIQNEENSWQREEIDFPIPRQSLLTNKIAADILNNKDCGLVSLEESYKTHKIFINFLLKKINSLSGTLKTNCEIT